MSSVARRLTGHVVVVAAALLATLTGIGSAQSPSDGALPTSGPVVEQLVSDDGRLTLTFPVGMAGPDVALTATEVATVVPAVAAYELRPLGTTFPAPVSVTWTLDPAGVPPATAGDLVWLGMARSDDAIAGPWAWLDDPHVTVVDGSYAVTGQLTRFGTLIVTQLPTLIHGPEAVWGPGYAPGLRLPIDLDLTLVDVDGGAAGTSGAASFSGDWRFGGGYPARISVTTTVAEADQLAAVWQCQLPGASSLAMTFALREGTDGVGPTSRLLGLPATGASFEVSFQVACGTLNPRPNG